MALLAERLSATDAFAAGLVSARVPGRRPRGRGERGGRDAEVRPRGGAAQDQAGHQRGDVDRTRRRASGARPRASRPCWRRTTSARAPGRSRSDGRRRSPTSEAGLAFRWHWQSIPRAAATVGARSTRRIIVRRDGGRSVTIDCVSTQFETGTTGGWRVLAPFGSREYRLLMGALSISIFAEGMWTVVMALQVIALDNDPASLSWSRRASARAWSHSSSSAASPRTASISAPSSSPSRRSNVAVVATVAVLGSVGALQVWHWPRRLPRSASRRRSSSPPTAPCCRGSCPPINCWRPTASRASCGRCSSVPSAPRWRAYWSG